MVKNRTRVPGEEAPAICKKALFIKLVATVRQRTRWRNPVRDETYPRDRQPARGTSADPKNKTGTVNAVPVCKTCLEENAG